MEAGEQDQGSGMGRSSGDHWIPVMSSGGHFEDHWIPVPSSGGHLEVHWSPVPVFNSSDMHKFGDFRSCVFEKAPRPFWPFGASEIPLR